MVNIIITTKLLGITAKKVADAISDCLFGFECGTEQFSVICRSKFEGKCELSKLRDKI